MSYPRKKRPVALSIGIMACNEEHTIEPMLASLFRQSVFDRLAARHEQAEVLVVANACTDRTADVVRNFFSRLERRTSVPAQWSTRLIEIAAPGRNNAWNRFVHEFSAVEARYLASLHADILLHHRDALLSLVCALERRAHVTAASGRRCEDVLFKEQRTFWERLAVASPPADCNRGGQINGELVCLRTSAARRIHLPPGLEAGFDRFVTEVVGTDFFSTRFDPTRIALPPDAAHICATHSEPREALDSRQRRMIGQTAAHVLLEYLRSRSWRERHCLLDTLRSHEAHDPAWLEKLLAAHVRRRRFFGQLFPGVLRLRRNPLPAWRRLRQIPEACTGFVFTLIACLRAHRWLRARSGAADAPRPATVLTASERSAS
jgi:hypothetical protein